MPNIEELTQINTMQTKRNLKLKIFTLLAILLLFAGLIYKFGISQGIYENPIKKVKPVSEGNNNYVTYPPVYDSAISPTQDWPCELEDCKG